MKGETENKWEQGTEKDRAPINIRSKNHHINNEMKERYSSTKLPDIFSAFEEHGTYKHTHRLKSTTIKFINDYYLII